jgi:AmmeMemoRadiSam system protein B
MEIPPEGFFPWAGIVSHHLLAHDYLDPWFSRLAEMRQVHCFYLLSPSHFGLSLETYSLTIGSWESSLINSISLGLVESDKNIVYKLAGLLDVNLDKRVFQFEHGVSTLMPYIKKYFPDAVVAAIACDGEPPVNIPISRRLADALEDEFDGKGRQENFLLISTDFSHLGNLEETIARDAVSRRFLDNPNDTSWSFAYCDNSPGIYILNRLGKNSLVSSILYHTNSWEIAHQGEDDITSYFFVYFADKNQ